MRKRYLLAATALAAALPALASAQQRPAARPAAARPASTMMGGTAQKAGAIELTIQPTAFIARDGALSSYLNAQVVAVGDAPGTVVPGAVGRFGYHINPKLALGANFGFGISGGATLLQYQAGATYTLSPDKKMSPLFTLGIGGSSWSGDGTTPRTGSASAIGAQVGLGMRRFVGEALAIRVDARAGMEKYGAASLDGNAIVGSVGAGLSYFMGGGPPADTDMDGVPDRRDGCANTARGATVDARGCPSDTDRDGVWNGLDRCPNTPANTPVDANGCTRDTDGDGIADNLDRCANSPRGTPVDANGCPRDTDGDGVADNADRCANTPRGTPVDANGCPRDTDGDGVLDNADRCPNTATGTPVDANGCPRDTDGDGVPDNADRCANTAAGTQVDANGCPIARDADADGVIDANDRCANTPRGTRVDASGCTIRELPAAGGRALVLENISFASGSSRLGSASSATLDEVARSILAGPATQRYEVGGYTSSTGSRALNLRLSTARAAAVRTYLISKGVPAARLTSVGYGPVNFVAPNNTAAGREANRRVELKPIP